MSQENERFIGFDFGLRRIGVAIGNKITFQSRPLPTLLAKQGEPNWRELDRVIRDWQPKALIVGLPTHIDGSTQFITQAATRFSEQLIERFHLPTYLVDERLSTVEARSMLFEEGGYKKIRQTQVDSMAACIILDQWLRNTLA